MHRATWLTIFAGTFGLSLSASLLAGEPPPPSHAGKAMQAFCWSSHNDYREPAIYFSEIFEIQVPKTAGSWYERDMGKVFEAYLTQKHGYVSPPPGSPTVFCSLMDSAAMAQGSKDQLIKQHQYYKQPVVETGWRMSAQQAEAAATAATAKPATLSPAAPQSPSMAYGYCRSSAAQIAYYSAAFGSPIYKHPQSPWDPIKATAVHWRQAFIEFLKKKYDFVGYTQCPSYASQAESQKDFDNMIRLARSAPPGQSVETGWVYTAATPVAAAPAAPAAPPKPATTSAARPAPAPTPGPALATAPKPVAATASTPAAVSSVHAVCWADFDQATRYYSAVFSGAGSDYGDWMPAFKQFLQQKYKYQGSVRCNKQPTQAEAQKIARLACSALGLRAIVSSIQEGKLRAKPLSISDVLRQPSFELAKQRFRASRVMTEPGEPSNKFDLLRYTLSTIDNMPFGAVQLVTYKSSLHCMERYQPLAAADCRKSSPEGVGHGTGQKQRAQDVALSLAKDRIYSAGRRIEAAVGPS